MTNNDTPSKSNFEIYEAGKARRYNLLFTVNAGAFAIVTTWAKLDSGLKPGDIDATTRLFGGLTAGHVSLGMVAYCFLMALDIYKFGDRFSGTPVDGAETRSAGGSPTLFTWVGKLVLIGTTGLMMLAWLLASGSAADYLKFLPLV